LLGAGEIDLLFEQEVTEGTEEQVVSDDQNLNVERLTEGVSRRILPGANSPNSITFSVHSVSSCSNADLGLAKMQ
jgi:hypothetical protein